ncbi:hypothetical protein GGF46_000304 [Coemansia sp. RSA 552]|nr:hypothetical protein GGF46_000304 [Coemansia sp. RSA 552]
MEPLDPEDEQCTCPAFSSMGEHTPTCALYTPISAMDIPEWQRRSGGSGAYSRSRPPSYTAYGIGIVGGQQQQPQSRAPSIAASYTSTSSMLDSMAATETESLSSYPIKRSPSACSFSSVSSTSFYLLPTELFREIFKYLDMEDLQTVVQVSRQWRSAGNPLLWRTMSFPLDKRRLAAMKPVLSHLGHHVRRVIITPPLVDSGGRSSRRVSTSTPRGWSLSRSASTSSQPPHQHHRHPSSQGPFEGLDSNTSEAAPQSGPSRPSASSVSMSPPQTTAVASSASGTGHSGASSLLPSLLDRPGPAQTSPSLPVPLSPPHQQPASNMTTPLADAPGLTSATSGSSMGGGRRHSRGGMAASPSPQLPPVYAVPIPGTPGPGNVISESLPLSASGSSWGTSGLGSMNIPSIPGSGSLAPRSGSTSAHHSSFQSGPASHFHEISEGTVLRMHQFMERFCPGVLEAVVRNPAGISSHTRRVGILARLFQAYPRLERLNLCDFIMWDPQPLRIVADQLHMLRSLDVTNRVELSDVDLLPVVENCTRLCELRIRATNATDATIHAIIRNLSGTLTSLNVGGCPVSSAAMSELVTTCRMLRALQMWSCLRLDDSFLLALSPRALPYLQVLDMMDVQKFSVDAVRRTFGQQTWPHMVYLRIRAKCDIEDFTGLPERAVLKLNSSTILD